MDCCFSSEAGARTVDSSGSEALQSERRIRIRVLRPRIESGERRGEGGAGSGPWGKLEVGAH
jgi:hypothetical protein